MERGRVLGWRTHGPGSGVERAGGWGKHEGCGASGCGVLGERLRDDGCGRGLAEQGADVAATEGEVPGTQAAGIRCAQGREQEEEAGEMAVPQTHRCSQGLAQFLYVKRNARGKGCRNGNCWVLEAGVEMIGSLLPGANPTGEMHRGELVTRIKKVVITAYGDESVLAVVEAELADPAAGEVQVGVEYSVVCGSDVSMRRGTYPFQKKPPLGPGYSVVGRVVANGAGCSKFQAGDRVASLTKYDGQAERINLLEKYLVRVPEGVDGGEAVALVLDWVTAYEMLERSAKVKAGQKIFVHALGGGVGGALLRLGKMMGAEVYGTASAKRHEELRALGAVPFDYSNKEWIGAMQRMGGVDAVFDPMGYESFDESYSILKKGGVLVGYGANLPAWTKTPARPVVPMVLKLFARNLVFWSGKRTTFFGVRRDSKYFATDLEQLFAWLKEGKISVPIRARFGLDEIQEAHREYERGARMGSIVIEVAG